jgi:hypothetical protein
MLRKGLGGALAVALSMAIGPALAQGTRVALTFTPESKTPVHELGHRMNLNLRTRPQDLDEHRLLFLYLYDLYVDLYGKEFADGQVVFGRTLKGLYDYDTAWTWTLAMTREERASRFAGVLKANGRILASADVHGSQSVYDWPLNVAPEREVDAIGPVPSCRRDARLNWNLRQSRRMS